MQLSAFLAENGTPAEVDVTAVVELDSRHRHHRQRPDA